MATTIDTIYANGVLRPLTPLAMPENVHVRVTLPDVVAEDDDARPWRGLFVPEPAPAEDRTPAFLQALPRCAILPETPRINLTGLRTHIDE